MPQDDHKPIHGDNKAQGSDNVLKQPGKQPDARHNDHKNGQDYASKMWHKIEGAVAKDKISGLKQELGGHKKRHRNRRRGKGHGDKHQVPLQPEKKHPTPAPISIPVPSFAPISPFGLPPKNYEPIIKAKLKQEKEKKVHDFTDTAKEDVIPINPFEMETTAKPLDTKSLDDKPLDQVGKPPKVEAAFYEEVKSPFDKGEAHEAEVTNVKEISNEPAMEDHDKPYSKEEIIDVTPKDQNAERKIEPVFPENIDNGNGSAGETGEFKEDFWSILEQAGITKKKAFIILISVVSVIVVGLFLLFGGYKIFQSDGGGESSVPDVSIEETDSSEPLAVGLTPYSIISSYIFGLEFTLPVTPIEAEPISSFGDLSGVSASFIFGWIGDLKAEKFVEYVRLLEKINNIYNVDVYSLVDLSVDRRKALDDYLKEMDDLIQQGMAAFENIEADLQSTDAQYEATTLQNEQYEALFFQYLQNFYGQTAYDTLQTFITSSHESVKLKAEYRAKNTLRTMFVNSLNLLRPKYKDVAANTEALIKGVKVFDVPKSDIDAIILLE